MKIYFEINKHNQFMCWNWKEEFEFDHNFNIIESSGKSGGW